MTYSIKKGAAKGIKAALVAALAAVTAAGMADVEVWSLVETHIKPLFGGITVAGGITMLLNYVKIKYLTSE